MFSVPLAQDDPRVPAGLCWHMLYRALSPEAPAMTLKTTFVMLALVLVLGIGAYFLWTRGDGLLVLVEVAFPEH